MLTVPTLPCLAAEAQLPPVTNGLVGLYQASSYSAASSRWLDLSGKGNHAVTTGTISKAVAADLNGKEYLSGGTSATVKWPQVSGCPLQIVHVQAIHASFCCP